VTFIGVVSQRRLVQNVMLRFVVATVSSNTGCVTEVRIGKVRQSVYVQNVLLTNGEQSLARNHLSKKWRPRHRR